MNPMVQLPDSSACRRFTTRLISGVLALTAALAVVPTQSFALEKLHFAVGPLQPTPGDTKKAFEPFFKYVADKLGMDYDVVATSDWAGVSVALSNKQADIAWMGPWGYVLAHQEGKPEAIATVKYDGKPVYHAIMLARNGIKIEKWPDDAKGLRLQLADLGSTSGWLIPTFWFKTHGIDPKTYFQYRDGSTHAANVTAVANGQVDVASDFDRNFKAMIEKGVVKASDAQIVWTSDPLPNDALAVRDGFDPALAKKVQSIVLAMTEDEAKAIMPNHYTGWVAATHQSYKTIEDAGIAVGKIKAAVSK